MGKILVVDDEPGIRHITRLMLEKAGHEVMEAETGEEGLEKVDKEEPDMVLLDVMMPKGLNGWKVCKMIKERFRDLPVVMFTVRGSPEDENMSIESGADGYIKKPFDMEDLLETVKMFTQRTG